MKQFFSFDIPLLVVKCAYLNDICQQKKFDVENAGGAVALGVELSNNPNHSTIDYTQQYIFVNGVGGIIAAYERPKPKPSINRLLH